MKMAKTENMTVRDALHKELYKIVEQKSKLKSYVSSTDADNAFSFEPNNIINLIEKIELKTTEGSEMKTIEIENIDLVKDYPPNPMQSEGQLPYLDMKEREIRGHVKENPDVKFRVRITTFGQGYVGANRMEISVSPSVWIERKGSCKIEQPIN